MNRSLAIVSSILLAGLATSCGPNATTGALVGGALGAGVGAIAGNQHHGHNGEGALIGAAAGAGIGAAVGNQKDQENRRRYEESQGYYRESNY
jgi:hypothetical protein